MSHVTDLFDSVSQWPVGDHNEQILYFCELRV